jgi:hypothetical protein
MYPHITPIEVCPLPECWRENDEYIPFSLDCLASLESPLRPAVLRIPERYKYPFTFLFAFIPPIREITETPDQTYE